MQAQPEIRVRAASRLSIHAGHRDGGLRLRGRLTDDLGVPLPRRRLELQVSPVSQEQTPAQAAKTTRSLRTDGAGRFETALEASPRPHSIRLRFPGDAHHEPSLLERHVDPAHAEVHLSLELPEGHRVLLDEALPPVGVSATSSGPVEGLRITLRNEEGMQLAQGRTDESGHARLRLSERAVGSAGVGEWVARSAADAHHDAAEARRTVIRVRRPELSLRSRSETIEADASLPVEGRLRTQEGGLPEMAVTLLVDGKKATTVLTGADGRFEGELNLHAPAGSDVRIHARYASSAPWLLDAVSSPLRVAIETPARARPWWLLSGVGIAAWLAWWLGRRPKALDEPGAEARGHGEPAGGVQPAVPRRLGRARLGHIGGSVRDTRSAAPLRDACVELRPEQASGGPLCVLVSDAGNFVSPPLSPGRWQLVAGAPGHEHVTQRLSIPHQGEWSDMQVWLESSRVLAERRYRPIALEVLRSPHLYEIETPREILARAKRQRRAPGELAMLTDRVERACYAAEPPLPEDIQSIEEAAERTLRALKTGDALSERAAPNED